MNADAKPLLFFLTDSTNSLKALHSMNNINFGQLDSSTHKLHLQDTRIVSVDLQTENKVCGPFGYLNHESEL